MRRLMYGLVVAVAFAAAAPGMAQTKKGGKAAESVETAVPKNVFFKGQTKDQTLARRRLIGARVVNKDGQGIGDIEDLILGKNNQVEGVIVGVGGFLGVNEKKIGVRYSALRFETNDGKTVISLPQATKEVLAKLEPYAFAEPNRSFVDRASESVRGAAKKASDAAKGLVNKKDEPKKDEAQKK
jgi:sporulation protein YlmC with PRC-barrel domain